jgi:sugar O-acyltransferase (sialic acid O-acetyltransferase NeuD family)
MVKKLIIVGAGDAGKELASIIFNDDNQKYNVIGFIDDDPLKIGSEINGLKVISSIDHFQNIKDTYLICSITNMKFKKEIIHKLETRNFRFTNFVHSKAIVNSDISNVLGLIIYPFSVVSNNVNLGDHIFINMHTTIGHNSEIGSYSVLSSHCDITGHVKIGESNFIGSHSTFVPKVKTGDNVRVGIGSVVINNIPDDTNVFGNPAKRY